MPMTKPVTELKVEKTNLHTRIDYHLGEGAFKIEMVKNADNLTMDLTAWYILDQRDNGFNK
jgi:hypothetical protein